MPHPLYPGLLAISLLLSALVCSRIVFKPFLDLPPFWNQLDVGVALAGYGALMLLSALVVNRRLWPRKWRLSRKRPAVCNPCSVWRPSRGALMKAMI